MVYTLISGKVIPAVTGGVFSYVRGLTIDNALLTSPAYILASYIIEQAIGSMTDPVDDNDWPLYVSRMPDGSDIKTNCGTLYDTSGLKDGRLAEGTVIQHYGLQLRIRSDTHLVGWAKAEAIAIALDGVSNEVLAVGSYNYQIYNIRRMGPVISLGMEIGTKARRLFTVNFLVTLKRIAA